ncbi:MAG: FAD-dependent oxidoreductase [Alphaproteobacteria bacterium]|nr:FAD-dependent oxidoreductase [Alphaproteobacteria bacterium]MBV9695145.1 FAD-dependent oxidoreductase [Alphaproteobacteria bacterium]
MKCVHVIGAGLAGLAAATALAAKGVRVELHEAAPQAGGRCRSYFDPVLGQTIDNGNHLILSGNRATYGYLRRIGAEHALAGPARARFAFADVRSGERWTIAPNDGPLPWWTLSRKRRVPQTSLRDYAGLLGLLWPGRGKRICEVLRCDGALWERLMRPFLLAALNTEPETASAALAAAVVRETMAKGGQSYRPRIAHPTLAATFVDPALGFLAKKDVQVHFGARLRRILYDGVRATGLDFGERTLTLAEGDGVVLAVPPWVAADLVPELVVPERFRAIVNAHFRVAPPPDAPLMLGVIGGTAEWIFSFPDRVSVTVSGADRIVDRERESLAETLWQDVAAALGLPEALPPWQIVKEKRATFAATPEQDARRPKAETRWRNLALAGDWTATGLPATLEGAVRSGHKAAEIAYSRTR